MKEDAPATRGHKAEASIYIEIRDPPKYGEMSVISYFDGFSGVGDHFG
jgi:hypothetical protein